MRGPLLPGPLPEAAAVVRGAVRLDEVNDRGDRRTLPRLSGERPKHADERPQGADGMRRAVHPPEKAARRALWRPPPPPSAIHPPSSAIRLT